MNSLTDIIRHHWDRLSDEEIAAYEDRRDEFFLAIRRKHGMLRFHAQNILHDIMRNIEDTFRARA